MALLAAPWRIFFVLAAAHAMAAPPLFLWAGTDPVRHGAGMVLGLGLGAVAGYALTALPGWDGAGPVAGRTSGLLAGLWCLALAGVYLAAPVLVWLFPLALAAVLLRRRHGDPKRLVVATAAAVATAATLTLGPAAGVTVLAALICFIGGRAVPAFLWGAAGRSATPPRAGPVIAAGLTLASLVLPEAALVAALTALWQIRHWPRGAWRRGAGAMLAGAWLALAGGLALRGVSGHLPVPQTGWIHVLGMGAMAGMIVAISGRAAMRRVQGRPSAGGAILTAFGLIALAALLRVIAVDRPALVALAAAVWSAGWAAYLLALWPVLSGPPPRPAFSGTRPDATPAADDGLG